MPQPVALIALNPQQWSYQTKQLVKQSASNENTFLTPNQRYHITLKLELPDSTINQNMGVITIHSQMQHRTSIPHLREQPVNQIQSLASSTRSFLVPYRNTLIQAINRLIWCVPMVLGIVDDAHRIDVQLFDDFVEHSSDQSTHLQIEFATPRSHLLQIQSASVQFEARLSGVVSFMYHWPISTSLVIISFLFSVQVAVVMIVGAVGMVCWHRKVNSNLVDEFDEYEPSGLRSPLHYDTLETLTAKLAQQARHPQIVSAKSQSAKSHVY